MASAHRAQLKPFEYTPSEEDIAMKSLAASLAVLVGAVSISTVSVPPAHAYYYRGVHYRYHWHGGYYHHRRCHHYTRCRYW
jgi:hypothetical protein